MANKWSKLALTFAVGLAVSTPASVFATNGYFSHGFSIKEKGLAGAGVAYPQDSVAGMHIGDRSGTLRFDPLDDDPG